MTNEQLLQRLQDTLPEDLSLEEIELLRERVGQSPELRDALAGQLYWDQFLATGLSRGNVSPELVVDRMRAQRMASRARLWRWIGLPLVLLCGGTAGLLALRALNRSEVRQVAELAKLPEPAASPNVAKPAQPKPLASAATQPPAAASAQPTVEDALAQFSTEKPRPFSETCFQPLVPVETEADVTKLKSLWRPVRGNMSLARSRYDTAAVALAGNFELRTGWPAGQVLRITPLELDRLQLELGSGEQSVSLRFVDKPAPQWAAYVRSPTAGAGSGHELLTATDDDRFRRTAGGPIELRYQDGLVVLSRGDILLLAAPLAQKPERVVIDAPKRELLGNLVFAPGERFPIEAGNKPAEPPAGDQQLAKKAAGELPPGTAEVPLADGAVELTASDNTKPGWLSFEFNDPGAREISFKIEQASPGTGIALVDSDNRPREGIGFQSVRRSPQLAVAYARPTDRLNELRENGRGLAPLVSTPLWVRIIAGPSLKCWTSVDGKHWGLALAGRTCDQWQRVAVYASAGKGKRSIRVGPIAYRSLPAITALAEKSQGRSFATASDAGSWLSEVLAAQPADIKRSNWLAGCAAATLVPGCRRDLARTLIAGLLQQAPELSLSFAEKIELIDELALLSEPGDAAARQIISAYVHLADHREAGKLWQPYSKVRKAVAESPPLYAGNTTTLIEPLVRAELLELVYRDAWDELGKLCRVVDFYEPPARSKAQRDATGQLADWALALVHRNRPDTAASAGAIPTAWRHPLVERLGKEGFNVLAELDAALSAGSYKDACQLISSVTPREATGLLPNTSDSALLVSLPGAVAFAMRDHPPLLATMQAEFAPLGQLRLRQATSAGDIAGVEAVTIQFYGTTAARQAHLWLGDRALTAGDFAEAEAHYRHALEPAGQDDAAVQARLRLAAAMQGRSVGEPVEDAVQLGEQTISADAFERMIAEMLSRSLAAHAADKASGALALLNARGALPSGFEKRRLAQLAIAPARRPPVPDTVSWDAVGCETTLSLTSKAAIVVNPAEIAAYDRSTGKPLWKIAGAPAPQHGGLWPPVAMRPVALESRIVVRRWQAGTSQLLAIDDGKIAWQTPPSVRVASDPLVVGGRVLAVTSATMPQEMVEISLAEFDPHSGQQLAQHSLAEFRDIWQRDIPCDVAVAGETILVVAGGCTIGCTRDGEAKWLRRDTWVGGVVDQRSWPRRYGPPLVSGPLACIAQPGVPALSVVEAASGRLVWQRPLADLVRLLAIAGGKLLVQTSRGFEALALDDGTTAWQHDEAQPLEGWLADEASGLMYVARASLSNRRSRVRLVWLDAKTGSEQASTLLSDWQPEQAMLGPLASDGYRIWAVAGTNGRDSTRELFELVPANARQAARSDDAWMNPWISPTPSLGEPDALLPGWWLVSTLADGRSGVMLDAAGRQTAVVTRASAQQPARWMRRVHVPDSGGLLKIELAPTASDAWKLTAEVNGRTALDRLIEKSPAVPQPHSFDVDLGSHAGKTVLITVTQTVEKYGQAYAGWSRLEVPSDRPSPSKPSAGEMKKEP